jgi:hypothetical protein
LTNSAPLPIGFNHFCNPTQFDILAFWESNHGKVYPGGIIAEPLKVLFSLRGFFCFYRPVATQDFINRQKGGDYAQIFMDGCLFGCGRFFLGKFRCSSSAGRKADRHRRYDRNEDRPGEEGTCTGHIR